MNYRKILQPCYPNEHVVKQTHFSSNHLDLPSICLLKNFILELSYALEAWSEVDADDVCPCLLTETLGAALTSSCHIDVINADSSSLVGTLRVTVQNRRQ